MAWYLVKHRDSTYTSIGESVAPSLEASTSTNLILGAKTLGNTGKKVNEH